MREEFSSDSVASKINGKSEGFNNNLFTRLKLSLSDSVSDEILSSAQSQAARQGYRRDGKIIRRASVAVEGMGIDVSVCSASNRSDLSEAITCDAVLVWKSVTCFITRVLSACMRLRTGS